MKPKISIRAAATVDCPDMNIYPEAYACLSDIQTLEGLREELIADVVEKISIDITIDDQDLDELWRAVRELRRERAGDAD
jgi:hypothetical protein